MYKYNYHIGDAYMKKILILMLCIAFVFAGCSNNSNEEMPTIKDSAIESYIGEGTKTALRALVNSNAFLVEEVFVKGHLPVDTDKTVTNDNGTFAPVVSDKIHSYEDLKNNVYSTYTKEIADELMNENRYVEIDGKLYFDMKFNKDSGYITDWSDFETEIASDGEDKYSIEIAVKSEKGKKIIINASAVTIDGSIRLENIYS